MAYTAVMVPVTDFLTGVLSALVIYGVGRRWFGEMAEPGPVAKPTPAAARQRELASA
jgi:sulfate permease, SulP family